MTFFQRTTKLSVHLLNTTEKIERRTSNVQHRMLNKKKGNKPKLYPRPLGRGLGEGLFRIVPFWLFAFVSGLEFLI